MEVELERLKASRSAAGYDPEELPGPLSEATAAVRVGKSASGDVALRAVKKPSNILRLRKGQLLAVVGKSETSWASTYHKQRAEKTTLSELLSFARQVVAAGADGRLLVRHAGHPGDGPHMPMFAEAPEDLTVSVQPGDLLLRFNEPELDDLFVEEVTG